MFLLKWIVFPEYDNIGVQINNQNIVNTGLQNQSHVCLNFSQRNIIQETEMYFHLIVSIMLVER